MRHPPLLVLILLAGCDQPESPSDCPPAFEPTEDGYCAFSEEAVAEIMRTFHQGDLVKINGEPFPQFTDSGVIRNVWITRLPVVGGLDTVDLYRMVDPTSNEELPMAFPVGTVVVHERVDGVEGSTVQVRREPGYENEGGGPWWFGKYYPDGTPDTADCQPCHMCHNPDGRPGSEGLWGVPLDARPTGGGGRGGDRL